jgi:hypothetical protein
VSHEVDTGGRAQFRVYCSPAFKKRVAAWAAAKGSNVSEAAAVAVAAVMKAEEHDSHAGQDRPGRRRTTRTVIVCSACETESCWQGLMMCEEARTAGVTARRV